MRCKICNQTFRSPPRSMREDQICSNCKPHMKTVKNLDQNEENSLARKAEQLEKKIKRLRMELEQKTSVKEDKDGILISLTPCPHCSITPTNKTEAIKLFGLRYNGTRRQSYCYKCRMSDQSSKREILPKLEKKEKVTTKKQIWKSISDFEKNSKEFKNKSLEKSNILNTNQHYIENDEKIKAEAKKIVYNLQKEKYLNIELIEDYVNAYFQLGSIRKVAKEKHQPEFVIRQFTKTTKRLPHNLKIAHETGTLSIDPKLSLNIALHVTDLFVWDGENKDHEEMLSMALQLSKFFKENPSFKIKFQTGHSISQQLSDVKEDPNLIKLKKLKKKYPYFVSPFIKGYDRTPGQYSRLVSPKNLEVAEFVLKWEHEKKQRIPMKWASELLFYPENFLKRYDFQGET